MEIWLDTTNVQLIQKAVRLGILAGVTTNPSIIAASNRSIEDILKDLLHYQEGPVAAQVLAEDTTDMVEEGKYIYSFSNRMIVKIPVTKNGLEALHLLSRQGIPTMATAIFAPHQALMASLIGADYLAPYLSRMEQSGLNPWNALNTMSKILDNYRLKTRILGASLKTVEDVAKCAEAGIYAVTIKDELFEKLIENHPLTDQMVQKFAVDWQMA